MLTHHDRLKKYWLNQLKTGRGGVRIYYRGSRMQRGHGLGTILGDIVHSPLVKKGLAYAAKTALDTGGDIISNIAAGQDLKTAATSGYSEKESC